MKRFVAVFVAAFFWISNAAWANPVTDEERRLISLAEKISVSEIDDDEKIERLTEIETRVSQIRKNRSETARTALANVPTEAPTPSRPVSTFVENQTDSASRDETEEEEPTLLSRLFFAAVRYVGITIAIGVAIIALAILNTEARAYFERRFDRSEWPVFHRPAPPVTSVRNFENPVARPVVAPAPVRQTFVNLVRKKPAVTRDGMVPPHLR